MEEIPMLGSLSSPFVVGYIDSFISDEKVNIIMEFCEGGDLQGLIESKAVLSSSFSIPELQIWRHFIQICLGVNYLHGKEILHRDLKPLNIFICKDNQLKIGDLGVARKLEI
jgi:NIMA (never in mitosis gene a)-related kinase